MVGLYIPGLARRGVAVLRLRGVLGEASACRLAASLRCAFAADRDLLITDVAGYLAARGGQMVLNAMGAHLRRTEPRLAALEVFADARRPGRPGRRTVAGTAAADVPPPALRARPGRANAPAIVAACADAYGWHPDAGSGTPGKTVWFARRIPRAQLRQKHDRAPPSCS